METKRPLNDGERELLARMLVAEFPGIVEVRAQIAASSILRCDVVGGVVFTFGVADDAVRVEVSGPVPVEAEGVDEDGMGIHILLHVEDGKVRELEIYREDGLPIRHVPLADSVRVSTNTS